MTLFTPKRAHNASLLVHADNADDADDANDADDDADADAAGMDAYAKTDVGAHQIHFNQSLALIFDTILWNIKELYRKAPSAHFLAFSLNIKLCLTQQIR